MAQLRRDRPTGLLRVKASRISSRRRPSCSIQRDSNYSLRFLAVLQLSKIGRNRTCKIPTSGFLVGQPKQLSDEPGLTPNIIARHPPNLPLPDHVHRFIALNCSPGRIEFSEALLGVDPAFNRAIVLLDDVVQVVDRSMVRSGAMHLIEA